VRNPLNASQVCMLGFPKFRKRARPQNIGILITRNTILQVYIGGTSTYNVAGNQSNTVLARVSAAALLDQVTYLDT